MHVTGKKVLVTGATGFFGRHLVPSLAARGFRVHAATRRDAALGEAVNVINVGDLSQNVDWSRHLEGIDAVVHTAALAHVTSVIPEAEYDKINRQATIRLAKATNAAGARLIFMSSVAAQSGPRAEHVLTEEDIPFPTTAYGRAKLRAEQEIVLTNNCYVILRPALTYGLGVIGNMNRIARLAALRVPPPFGMMRNQRSFLAVENLCDAVDFVLTSDAVLNQIYILSDPEPISIAEMVTLIRAGAGLSGDGIPVPPALMSGVLSVLGRGELWEKIGGNLVASAAKLRRSGFRWRINTRDGMRALGAAYTRAALRQRAVKSASSAYL